MAAHQGKRCKWLHEGWGSSLHSDGGTSLDINGRSTPDASFLRIDGFANRSGFRRVVSGEGRIGAGAMYIASRERRIVVRHLEPLRMSERIANVVQPGAPMFAHCREAELIVLVVAFVPYLLVDRMQDVMATITSELSRSSVAFNYAALFGQVGWRANV